MEMQANCEICWIVHMHRVIADLLLVEHWYVVRAREPSGELRVVTESDRWHEPRRYLNQRDRQAKTILDRVIATLEEQGWEYTGKGTQWYTKVFRRALG